MVKNDGSWNENRKNRKNIAIKEVGVVKVTKKKQNNAENGWNKIRSALSNHTFYKTGLFNRSLSLLCFMDCGMFGGYSIQLIFVLLQVPDFRENI